MIALAMSILLATATAEASGWTVEGVLIPARKLTVHRETKTVQPRTPGGSARVDDVFNILTDFGPFELKYARLLAEACREGEEPLACPTGELGLGIRGLGSNWYWNDTIRVSLDGEDVMRRYAAHAIDVREGVGVARVRFLWKFEQADVAVHVAIVDGRGEGFVGVTVAPHRRVTTVGVLLRCFPGGYGPSCGAPSRRVIQTSAGQVSVATGEPARKLAVTPGCEWIWYADREGEDRGLHSSGSVALVMLPEDGAWGEVMVTSYGVDTRLRYPGSQRRVRLALAAYPGPNPRAWRSLAEKRHEVALVLRTLDFWPE